MKKAESYKKQRQGYMNSINDMRKKMGFHILILGIIAVAVILFAVFCTIHMKAEDVRITKSYVKNYTDQIADMIGMHVDDVQATAESLAESFEKNHIRENFQEFLDQKRCMYNLDVMAICDPSGKVLYESGECPGEGCEIEILNSKGDFRQSLDEGECAVGISNGYVFYAKNIHGDGMKKGTFWIGTREKRLRDIFVTRTFQKENSASFIMDGTGEILLGSNPDRQSMNFSVFFPDYKKEEVNKAISAMQKDLAAGKSGTFEFRSRMDRTYYFTYALPGVNDWVAVTLMPADLFTGFSDCYVARMLGCIVAVFAIFAAFFFLLYRSYIQNGRRLERLAFYDEVTGGINRVDFRLKYQKLCREHRADDYTLVLMDCMDFKLINESLGDRNGDRMLRYFYEVIRGNLYEDEIVARTEMDHFFILIKEKRPEIVCERVYKITDQIRSFQNTNLPHCDINFWLAACPVESNRSDLTLLQDRVIAVIKRQSPQDTGKLVYYDKKLSDKMQKERRLDSMFEKSLARGDFQVYLQPKVNFRSGEVVGAEALVRWILPDSGVISPGDFIPTLEGSGKICVLDRYVFEKVCETLQRWKREGKKQYPISVNLSRSHFIEGNFVEEFVRIADKYQTDRSLIEFEVTETIFMDTSQTKKAKEELRLFHEYGFRCSLDDFGVGFSSLTLLREFNIDVLKLDRSFFLSLQDGRARDLISCVLDMAEKLNMTTVIEGIETTQQMEYLNTVNCDVIQGFFFSRPIPVQEFEAWTKDFRIEEYMEAHEWAGASPVVERGKKTSWDEEERRRLGYLEDMPVACCAVDVLLDENKEPYDFRFTYANRAQEELEGIERGGLTGKKFTDIFENPDPEWYRYYYKTAYEGIPQVFQRYSPELDKHLLIHTFQTKKGSCGSVIQDVSEEYFLSQELKRSREEMKHILEETTALVFQYHPDEEKVILTRFGKKEFSQDFELEQLLKNMISKGILEKQYLDTLRSAFKDIKDGYSNVSVTIRARREEFLPMNWYRLTLFEFREGAGCGRKVLGYMQNVEAEMQRQEAFRKQAQRDSLTGVMNVGTGRKTIEKRLELPDNLCCKAMFLIDIDDFKKINDTKGHMVGDEVLKAFASTLERTFRSDDIVYRLGGDEFVVFVDDITDCDAGINAIMRRFTRNMNKVKETHPYLTSSVGVFVTDRRHTFEDFYREADRALYITKKEGKNSHTVIKDMRSMNI